MTGQNNVKIDEEFDKLEAIYRDLASSMLDPHPKWTPLVLKRLFSLEEAEIVRELPASPKAISAKLGIGRARIENIVDEHVKKGSLLLTAKGPKMLSNTAQYADLLIPNPAYDKERGDEFLDMLKSWFLDPDWVEGHARAYKSIEKDGNVINRVLPRWKAIKDIPGVMPCEDIREILDAYRGSLTSTRCFCRTIFNGRGCAIHEGTYFAEGHCIHFGEMADYYVNVQKCAKYLNVNEILDNLEAIEKSPVYQMVGNLKDVKWMCNCCDCCCLVAGSVKRSKGFSLSDMLSPSRFLATIDKDKCSGEQCKICVSKCPFHAIEIEEKSVDIKAKECFGCGACVVNCPEEALRLKIVRPPEHIPEVGPQLVEQFILETGEKPRVEAK